MMSTRQAVLSLYRRSLKLTLDWAVHRHLWRGQALYIRTLFEANKNITSPRQQRALIKETEKLLEKWKHPDPFAFPTAPGGSKYERNLPAPILDGEWQSIPRLKDRLHALPDHIEGACSNTDSAAAIEVLVAQLSIPSSFVSNRKGDLVIV